MTTLALAVPEILCLGAYQNLNGSRDKTMPLSRRICLLWTRTSCDQRACQNWSLYLHPLRRHERRYKMWKMG